MPQGDQAAETKEKTSEIYCLLHGSRVRAKDIGGRRKVLSTQRNEIIHN